MHASSSERVEFHRLLTSPTNNTISGALSPADRKDKQKRADCEERTKNLVEHLDGLEIAEIQSFDWTSRSSRVLFNGQNQKLEELLKYMQACTELVDKIPAMQAKFEELRKDMQACSQVVDTIPDMQRQLVVVMEITEEQQKRKIEDREQRRQVRQRTTSAIAQSPPVELPTVNAHFS